MIGFAIDYVRDDTAIAVTAVSSFLEQCGEAVQIFPLSISANLSPTWDRRVGRLKDVKYDEWISRCTNVVFALPPWPELLATAAKKKVKTHLLCDWLQVIKTDRKSITGFDNVICPARAIQHWLTDRYKPNATTLLPWTSMLSPLVSNREIDQDRIAVIIDLDGSQPALQSSGLFKGLEKLLAQKQAYLTVLYGDDLPDVWHGKLENLRFKADGRMEAVKNATPSEKVLLMEAHDLMLWPALSETFAMPGDLAVTASTPILAYDHPVIAEQVRHNRNGFLVECELREDDVDAIYAVPNEQEFFNTAVELIKDCQVLEDIRVSVQTSLQLRQATFKASILAIFQN